MISLTPPITSIVLVALALLAVALWWATTQPDWLRRAAERVLGPGIPAATLTVFVIAGLIVLPAVTGVALWFHIRVWIAIPLGLSCAGLLAVLGDQQRSQFQADARSELSDMLDIVARGMRVGMSFEQTLALATERRRGPVARAIAAIDRDTSLGLGMSQALAQQTVRLGVPEFAIFASLVNLQQETGGSLASRLAVMVTSMAERRDLEQRFRLAVLQIRLQANILAVFLAFLCAQTFLTNRANTLFLLYDDLGRQMLAGSACLTALGWMAIWSLVRFAL